MEAQNRLTQELRLQTMRDLKARLKKSKRCALVRCTGFGKTWLLSEMTHEYKSVLYLYPAEVIKDTVVSVIGAMAGIMPVVEDNEDFDFRNIRFMTYMKLIRLSEDEIDVIKDSFDLIIMDECHRIGAERTSVAVSKLLDGYEGHVVGATATPDRMDAIDVISKFLYGECTYEYTLHDAFQDGIIKRPIYCYCSHKIATDLEDAAREAGADMGNPAVQEMLSAKLIEISNIYKVDNIIRDVTTQYSPNKDYYKFIVFFANLAHMEEKGFRKGAGKEDITVLDWFEKAFPEYEINILQISSKNQTTAENVHRLGTLSRKKGRIDLIYCVDMLNMGYHVDDLTGIVMYRGTYSSTIYIQQLGRVLSTGTNNQCIVFDIVDNLHRKSFFCLSEEAAGRRKKKHGQKITDGSSGAGDMDLEHEVADDKLVTDDDSIIPVDDSGETPSESWWHHCNDLTPEDLIATAHEAEYRELIRKAVAEQILQRVKRAYEEHYKRWVALNGLPYPASAEDLLDKKLCPPLAPYARWQQVTVEQVLDLMLKKDKITT